MKNDPMSNDPIDDRLRQLMGEMAAAAPLPPDLSDDLPGSTVGASERQPRRYLVLAGAAVALLSLLGVGLYTTRSSPQLVSAGESTVVPPPLAQAQVTPADDRMPADQIEEPGEGPLCPGGYTFGTDPSGDEIVDICYVDAAAAEAPEVARQQPEPGSQSPCPDLFPFGTDTTDDGIVDTCYDDAAAAEVARQQALFAEEVARRAQAEQAALDRVRVLDVVADARALWESAAVGDYRMQYEVAPAGELSAVVTVLVENGAPSVVGAGGMVTESTPVWTVEDLFDVIESTHGVSGLSFDPILGYPSAFTIDPDDEIAGDETSVEVFEFLSVREIETATIELPAWLPDPVELPAKLIETVEHLNLWRTNSTEIGDAYPLHNERGVEVYAYWNEGDLCLVSVRITPLYGSGGARCQSDALLARDGTSLVSTAEVEGELSLIVIPPARYINEDWSVEVTAERGHSIELTERSALITFAAGDAEEVTAIVRCECGDLTYTAELIASK